MSPSAKIRMAARAISANGVTYLRRFFPLARRSPRQECARSNSIGRMSHQQERMTVKTEGVAEGGVRVMSFTGHLTMMTVAKTSALTPRSRSMAGEAAPLE